MVVSQGNESIGLLVYTSDIDILPLFLTVPERSGSYLSRDTKGIRHAKGRRNEKERETSLWGPYDFHILGLVCETELPSSYCVL